MVFLTALPAKFERFHRTIEELAGQRMDEARLRAFARQLDELKAGATSLGLHSLGDTFGMMGMMARRGGGLQLKVRGLREGLASLRVNYDGALRAASTPEESAEAEGA